MAGITFPDEEDGAQIKVSITPLPEGGQGLSWDVFGPELRTTPILFPPEGGQMFFFVGTDLAIGYELLVLSEYGLSVSGGGSILLGSDLLALSEYDVVIASGGVIVVGGDALALEQYEVQVAGGSALLLTDGTPLLLTDGTPLLLEAA